MHKYRSARAETALILSIHSSGYLHKVDPYMNNQSSPYLERLGFHENAESVLEDFVSMFIYTKVALYIENQSTLCLDGVGSGEDI